jgi:hypothetical protein
MVREVFTLVCKLVAGRMNPKDLYAHSDIPLFCAHTTNTHQLEC